jgi:hypothetical protein
MDFSRLNQALWNQYLIEDKQAEIAHVKQQLSSPPQASSSASTGNSSSTSGNSEKGAQANGSTSAVSKKLF